MQDQLILVAGPATLPGALIGKRLLDLGALTIAGNYDCLIPLEGMSNRVEVHITATIAGGTATTDLDTLFYVTNAADPATWTLKQAGTGDGALTTTVRQTSQLTTLAGEKFARCRIVLGGSPNVTFTLAEYNGL
jgi:hypothetical protein